MAVSKSAVYMVSSGNRLTVLDLIQTAAPDTTKLSCLCRVRFKTGVDRRFKVWTRSAQSSSSLRHAHQTRHRQDRLVASGGRCELGVTVAFRVSRDSLWIITTVQFFGVSMLWFVMITRCQICSTATDRSDPSIVVTQMWPIYSFTSRSFRSVCVLGTKAYPAHHVGGVGQASYFEALDPKGQERGGVIIIIILYYAIYGSTQAHKYKKS